MKLKPILDNCPYWDKVKKQDCNLTKGGLYLPLPEHIEIFCGTQHFTQCNHYIMGCELLGEATATDAIYDDSRRRYRRTKDQLPVSFIRCDDNGRYLTNDPQEQAMTVDLSIGGLCLKSKSKVHTDELLLLQLDEKTEQSSVSGFAEVRWCKTFDESSEYFVGLAFRKIETGLAIGKQMNLTIA